MVSSHKHFSLSLGWHKALFLGLYYFSIFIDLIANHISPDSRTALFSDDIALYRPIFSNVDFSILQRDVSAVAAWIDGSFSLSSLPNVVKFLLPGKRTRFHPEVFLSEALP